MPYTTHGHWFGPGAPFPRWPHAVAANRRADNAVERRRKAEAKLAKLSALEAAGVDNWDGYSYAMEILAERGGDSDG